MGKEQREGDTESEAGSELLAQSPTWGLNPQTMWEWPELKSGHLTNWATSVALHVKFLIEYNWHRILVLGIQQSAWTLYTLQYTTIATVSLKLVKYWLLPYAVLFIPLTCFTARSLYFALLFTPPLIATTSLFIVIMNIFLFVCLFRFYIQATSNGISLSYFT